ncbi:MAG TPA: hypothetical protein VG756_28495 [Pseudonocardiaceae bacterium]|jgi:hypothetical protein|nr:hypothetical protein [Pseudonocardiaceae bacterium]
MGAMADAFAQGANNLAAIQRESADRRSLLERKATTAQAEAKEAFSKQGPTMQRYAEHVGELVKRREKAGGWETSSALRDDSHNMRLGYDDDEEPRQDQFDQYRPAALGGARSGGTDGGQPAAFGSQAPEANVPPPPPAEPVPPAPPRGRRSARPAHDEDDDDLSNQSWMR